MVIELNKTFSDYQPRQIVQWIVNHVTRVVDRESFINARYVLPNIGYN
jgi:hypothetical protein